MLMDVYIPVENGCYHAICEANPGSNIEFSLQVTRQKAEPTV